MTDLAMDGLMRELTSEELALIAGGSSIPNPIHDIGQIVSDVGNGIEHVAADVGNGIEHVPADVGNGIEHVVGAVVSAAQFFGL